MFSSEGLSLACRWQHSHYPYTVFPLIHWCLCAQIPSLYKDIRQIRLESMLWPHFNLITSLKFFYISKQTYSKVLGAIASTYKFRGTQFHLLQQSRRHKELDTISDFSFLFFLIWPCLWHAEVLRPEIESVPQQRPEP